MPPPLDSPRRRQGRAGACTWGRSPLPPPPGEVAPGCPQPGTGRSVILRRESRRRISPPAQGQIQASPLTQAPHSLSTVGEGLAPPGSIKALARKGFGEFAACADSPNPFIWKRPLPPGGDKPPPLWRGGSPPRIGHDPLITPFPHRRDGHWPSALRTAVLKNGRTSNARPYDWRRLPPSRRGEARPSRQHKSIGKKRVRRIRSMCGFAEPFYLEKAAAAGRGQAAAPVARRLPAAHRARSPDHAVPTP